MTNVIDFPLADTGTKQEVSPESEAAPVFVARNSIHAISPFTLLDFPGQIACIVWFAKCNLRCVYCHNPDIVDSRGTIDFEGYESFLLRRMGRLNGVVLSGGEPTLCADLPRYAARAKELGFKVKLDTNGTRPDMLAELLDKNLIDMVAMDYKCLPQSGECLLGTEKFMPLFDRSLKLLIAAQDRLTFELRTTVHADFMQDAEIVRMIETLDAYGYRGTYYLQNIISTGEKTVGHVAAPARALDAAMLPKPKNFQMGWRNFKYRGSTEPPDGRLPPEGSL